MKETIVVGVLTAGVLLAIIVSICLMIAYSVFNTATEPEIKQRTIIKTYPLAAFKDNDIPESKGQFSGFMIMGFGVISGSSESNNVMKYYYYIDRGDGFTFESMEAENRKLTIHQDEEKEPYLKKIKKTISKKQYKGTFIEFITPNSRSYGEYDERAGNTRHEFHIPKGSIIKQFSLDMK